MGRQADGQRGRGRAREWAVIPGQGNDVHRILEVLNPGYL